MSLAAQQCAESQIIDDNALPKAFCRFSLDCSIQDGLSTVAQFSNNVGRDGDIHSVLQRVKFVQTRGVSGFGRPISFLPMAMLRIRKTMLRASTRIT